ARVSGLTIRARLAAAILARASGLLVRPLLAADILARASGLWVRPLRVAAILARVSGLTSWPFCAADILARVSGLRVRPFLVADILARVSGLWLVMARSFKSRGVDGGRCARPNRRSPRGRRPDHFFRLADDGSDFGTNSSTSNCSIRC